MLAKIVVTAGQNLGGSELYTSATLPTCTVYVYVINQQNT